MFGLTSQLRRALVSVPANFAEGYKETGDRDKARFHNIAQGSPEVCRYDLILTRDLGYGETDALALSLEETGRMLSSYVRTIQSRCD